MNLNDDIAVVRAREAGERRPLRLGPLHQLHPGRSRSLVRHHDRLHRPPACVWYVVIFRIPLQTSENRTAKLDAPVNSSASQTRGSGRCDGTGRQSRSVDATVRSTTVPIDPSPHPPGLPRKADAVSNPEVRVIRDSIRFNLPCRVTTTRAPPRPLLLRVAGGHGTR